jgi:SAM-dependent methyltransferase
MLTVRTIRAGEFWRGYWEKVPVDPDRITNKDIYPLYPIDEFVSPELRILEAGCGMGRVFKHYFLQGYSITGLEYDAGCLSRLRAENPAFPLLRGDARHLLFRSGSFDTVMAFGVVSTIADGHLEVLRECRRALRPGGLLCASAVSHTWLRRLQNAVSMLQYIAGRLRGRTLDLGFHARAYRPPEWRKLLEDEGFQVLRIEPTHSRMLFWEYLPFLRKPGVGLDPTQARNGDAGYVLRPWGERLFQWAKRQLPWLISIGVVAVAVRKDPPEGGTAGAGPQPDRREASANAR